MNHNQHYCPKHGDEHTVTGRTVKEPDVEVDWSLE